MTSTVAEKIRCERECARLCKDFIYTIDRRQYDAFLTLFAPDPVLERVGHIFSGMDGLRTFCAGRASNRYVRHTCSNIRIDMTGPQAATGTSCATMFQATAEPDAALPLTSSMLIFAEYDDQYVLIDTGWKIKSRKITVVFQP